MKMWFILSFVCVLLNNISNAQNSYNILLNESMLVIQDRVDLKRINILSNKTSISRVTIEGSLIQKGQNLMNFSKSINLSPGINDGLLLLEVLNMQFRNSSIQHLYNTYGMLPLGNYEYCIRIVENQTIAESRKVESVEECISILIDNNMLLELIDPEDNAKIKTLFPTLNWIFNSPLIAECTYNLNIVEMKNNQSKYDAIQRNMSVFKDNGLRTFSLTYPQYAKALIVGHKYAWNVNAYFNGLLVATAAPWSFEIIPEKVKDTLIYQSIFYDINSNNESYVWDAVGVLKMKYLLKDAPKDSLIFTLYDNNNQIVKNKVASSLKVNHGDNRIELNFYENSPLKHNKIYKLNVSGTTIDKDIYFKYLNPELIAIPNEENNDN